MTSLKSNFTGVVLRRLTLIATFLALASAGLTSSALCTEATMQAPKNSRHKHPASHDEVETSVVKIVFLGAIDFYRYAISPRSGSHCGFSPSCSTFGRQAVSEYGPIQGVMMTADRLTRCNAFKEPDQNYLLLPDSKLFDPVFYNALSEQ